MVYFYFAFITLGRSLSGLVFLVTMGQLPLLFYTLTWASYSLRLFTRMLLEPEFKFNLFHLSPFSSFTTVSHVLWIWWVPRVLFIFLETYLVLFSSSIVLAYIFKHSCSFYISIFVFIHTVISCLFLFTFQSSPLGLICFFTCCSRVLTTSGLWAALDRLLLVTARSCLCLGMLSSSTSSHLLSVSQG